MDAFQETLPSGVQHCCTSFHENGCTKVVKASIYTSEILDFKDFRERCENWLFFTKQQVGPPSVEPLSAIPTLAMLLKNISHLLKQCPGLELRQLFYIFYIYFIFIIFYIFIYTVI